MDEQTAAAVGVFRDIALRGGSGLVDAVSQLNEKLNATRDDVPAPGSPDWWDGVERSATNIARRVEQMCRTLKVSKYAALEKVLGDDAYSQPEDPLHVGLDMVIDALETSLKQPAADLLRAAKLRDDRVYGARDNLWLLASRFTTDVETSDFLSNEPKVHSAYVSAFSSDAVAQEVAAKTAAPTAVAAQSLA